MDKWSDSGGLFGLSGGCSRFRPSKSSRLGRSGRDAALVTIDKGGRDVLHFFREFDAQRCLIPSLKGLFRKYKFCSNASGRGNPRNSAVCFRPVYHRFHKKIAMPLVFSSY